MKGRITQVGTITTNDQGTEVVSGWGFDCLGNVPPFEFDSEDDKKWKVCGYTSGELREIASRRSEWEGAS